MLHKVLAGMLLLSMLAQAQIYRWTDEQGRVHFSAQPGHRSAQTVEVRPQVMERDALTREREARLEKIHSARRDERAQAQQQSQEERQERGRECRDLREQLASLSRGGRYFYRDQQGEHHYYSDQQVTDARSRLSGRIAQRCG